MDAELTLATNTSTIQFVSSANNFFHKFNKTKMKRIREFTNHEVGSQDFPSTTNTHNELEWLTSEEYALVTYLH